MYDLRDGLGSEAGRAIHRREVLPIDQCRRQRAAHKSHAGQFLLQLGQLGRCFAGVGHRDLRTCTHTPARHGHARSTQAQNQHTLALQMLRLALRPLGGHGRQLHHLHRLLRLGLRDFVVCGVRDTGVGKNLGHKSGSVLGSGQRIQRGNHGVSSRYRFYFCSLQRLFINYFRCFSI